MGLIFGVRYTLETTLNYSRKHVNFILFFLIFEIKSTLKLRNLMLLVEDLEERLMPSNPWAMVSWDQILKVALFVMQMSHPPVPQIAQALTVSLSSCHVLVLELACPEACISFLPSHQSS